MRLPSWSHCLLLLVTFGCGSTSREPKPTRDDGAAAPTDASSLAGDVPTAAGDALAVVSDASDARFEQNSGDPASPPRVIAKAKHTAADKALLAFARTCAEKKRDAGSTNIDVDSGRLTRVDTRAAVWFAEKRATPAGEYLLDVSDTKRGCVWIPRE
ncbi:MAG TPA: hypothetical protein VIV11_32095 [Kofleriaceae bacterium]